METLHVPEPVQRFRRRMFEADYPAVSSTTLYDVDQLAEFAVKATVRPVTPPALSRKFICLVGPSRSGKDTVAEMLETTAKWRFRQTLSRELAIYVNALLDDQSVIDRWYERRHEMAVFLREFGDAVRRIDVWALLAFAVVDQDVICGCRSLIELCELRRHFPCLVLWIEAGDRVNHDPTLMIQPSHADFVLPNLETKVELLRRVKALAEFL